MAVSERLKEVIDRLEYDFSQFELAHFIQHIERLKRREIILTPLPFEPIGFCDITWFVAGNLIEQLRYFRCHGKTRADGFSGHTTSTPKNR